MRGTAMSRDPSRARGSPSHRGRAALAATPRRARARRSESSRCAAPPSRWSLLCLSPQCLFAQCSPSDCSSGSCQAHPGQVASHVVPERRQGAAQQPNRAVRVSAGSAPVDQCGQPVHLLDERGVAPAAELPSPAAASPAGERSRPGAAGRTGRDRTAGRSGRRDSRAPVRSRRARKPRPAGRPRHLRRARRRTAKVSSRYGDIDAPGIGTHAPW